MKIFTQMLSTAAGLVAPTSVSAQTLYDTFENTRLVTYPVAEGVFTQNALNPGTNGWETLTFRFLSAPSTTPSTGLNEIVLLIAPNTLVRRRVYFDDWTGPSLVGFVSATRTVKTAAAAFAPAYPNPASGLTRLPFSLQKPAVVSLVVFDNLGRRVA